MEQETIVICSNEKTGIVGLFGKSNGYLLCSRKVGEQVNVFIGYTGENMRGS